MSDPAKPAKPTSDLPLSEEARMRHALGLREEGAVPRSPVPQRRDHEGRGRRFVKDGEVPVVVLNGSARESPAGAAPPTSRIVALEAALKAERQAHERAEHALREAQAGIGRLETKLAHAEMAHAEALAAERRARETAEETLGDSQAARAALEAKLAELESRLAQAQARPARARRAEAASAAAHAPGEPRRQAPKAAEKEPEPVKWWLPSYRAKSGNRK
jgi:DNA repair exonuclease SbcCD ATPase subunit